MAEMTYLDFDLQIEHMAAGFVSMSTIRPDKRLYLHTALLRSRARNLSLAVRPEPPHDAPR